MDRAEPAALPGGRSRTGGAALSVAARSCSPLRNPLAEPYVLGVSAGASVGAAAVVAFGFTAALGGLALPTAAFLGALASTALVYALARSGGRIPGPTLLLSGVVVASVLGSLVSVLLFLSGGQNRMEAVILWTMGGFSEVDWARVAVTVVPILVCAVVMWALGRDLNLLAFGEDPARFLGADVEPLKVTALIATALLTACAVAMGGVIGFVGLMAPHAARRLVGPDHRILIPSTALLGAVLLILGDLLGRSVHPPLEIPSDSSRRCSAARSSWSFFAVSSGGRGRDRDKHQGRNRALSGRDGSG